MNRFCILLIIVFGFAQLSIAQEMGYGIRVGLNFNKVNGPSETDMNGNDLETFNFNTGFHVGGVVIFKFTDLVGVKTGVFFSQRGMKYEYNGDSFQFFNEELSKDMVNSFGNRKYQLSVSNSYIEIPITAYYKITNWLEVNGGVLLGFLANSSAIGEFEFDGNGVFEYESGVVNGNADVYFVQSLDFNYRKDLPASPDDINDDTPVYEFATLNDFVIIPQTVGAYYMDYSEKSGNFYNTVDFGLTAGISFYLNGGLFLMLSGNYGLVDATNNFYDISRYQSNGLEYVYRNDKDTNVSLQVSIGFSF